MSKRKDRARFLAQKEQNPDYTGFRGQGQSSGATTEAPLESITCSQCGRRRNVAAGVVLEHPDDYVCATCQEELDSEAEGASVPADEQPADEEAG